MIGGRYALRTAIGNGGMGTVWRASDTLLRREVAVKEVLLPQGMAPADRDAMYQRTLREARAAAALSHPAVVQVYDVVTDGGRPWIVMELLQARSLAEMIVEDGPVAARAVAKIGVALLGALEVAHAAGVLHRDVKPANVLICSDGRCVLTDFGVARMPTDAELTTPGMVLGSPHFISPERAVGARFGPPSDLFSLGVTLYTAVEGHPPFDKSDPFETMRAVVEDPPAPAMRAGALAGVLYGLLEKDPSRRWDVPTARAVLRDLLSGALVSSTPAHETDPYAVVRPQPWTPPTAPTPGGQIGGRAMLAPGETLSTALRRLRGGGGKSAAAPAPLDQTNPGLRPVARDTPSMEAVFIQPGRRPNPPPAPPVPGINPASRRAAQHARPGASDAALSSARELSARALDELKKAPRAVRIGLVAGVSVAVLAAGVVGVVAMAAERSTPGTGAARPSASAAGSLIAVDAYHDADLNVTVNVPKGWTKSTNGSYVDFTDPQDKGRRLRINVERAGGNAQQFLGVAERGLKDPAKKTCAVPYARVDLRDVQLAGQPAAELEYKCGQGDQMRHAIWRATVIRGKAYSFFVTVPASRFDESMAIYQEMVRSFQIDT
jgi:serine/threonine protein kinase